jgi:cytoskeletal protein RodZ
MMRLCPKCGDYYADAALAFCLSDGAPLASVEPSSESWSEGARVIEEKENALKRQTRKLKWRRVALRAMTMALAVMVVCVVAVNSWIYLRPQPEEPVTAEPLTPTAAAKPDDIPITPRKAIPTKTRRPTRTTETTASPVTTDATSPPRDTKPPGTPTQTANVSPTNTQTPTPEHGNTGAGKPRELKIVIEKFGDKWRRKIIKRPG